MMTFIRFDTYIFYSRESAERFREELRRWGLWSSFGVSRGCAKGYSVRVAGGIRCT
jgi:hypothetical protein